MIVHFSALQSNWNNWNDPMTVKMHWNAIQKSPKIAQNLRPRLVALKRAKDKRQRSFRSRWQNVAQSKLTSVWATDRKYCVTKGTQLERFKFVSHWLTTFRTYSICSHFLSLQSRCCTLLRTYLALGSRCLVLISLCMQNRESTVHLPANLPYYRPIPQKKCSCSFRLD